MPAVDILGGLQEIRQNASVGAYSSQYAFDKAVANLVLGAHDGHFTYIPALLSTFSYHNNVPLISISEDGLVLPEVYIGSKSNLSLVCDCAENMTNCARAPSE